MSSTYAQRLKIARKAKKLTQEQLAEKSGVPQGTISKIERGDQSGSSYDVDLAHYLEINPMWLKYGDIYPADLVILPIEHGKIPSTFDATQPVAEKDVMDPEFIETLFPVRNKTITWVIFMLINSDSLGVDFAVKRSIEALKKLDDHAELQKIITGAIKSGNKEAQ